MLRRRAPAVCTAAVAVPAPAGLTGSASAGPSPHLAPAGAGRLPPGPLRAMRRDLGLSADRATQRIGNEFRAVAVAAALRRSLGAGFAGARLSGDAAELTVATTDAADTDTITRAGARAVVVDHSLAELTAGEAALDRVALRRAPKDVPARYVGVRTDRLVVQTGRSSAADAFLAKAGTPRGPVTAIRRSGHRAQPGHFASE
ncbi:S1 family peptidase [Streptomyces sp. NPDC005406]|uniref:S1 family peptidase n=1 Tax=Streptomyces sp. NPDC005406 TaxID=3155339 RepID=UPI003452B500